MHRSRPTSSFFLRTATMLCFTAGMVQAASAQLRVGTARLDITPSLLPGTEGPTGKYEHEHLYVRAIVLDNGKTRAALIGMDQSNMQEAIWDKAAKEIARDLDIPVANILISATHTHSPGVAMGPPPGPGAAGGMSPDQQRIATAIAQAVHEAKGKMQPAVMAFGTGNAYLNVNRDNIQPETKLWTQAPNLNAASDKTVAVLKFQTPAGQPIAAYVNYAMHPINGYLANFTSADYAGAMSRYVEQAYDEKAVVIFTQGASGDQNPLYLRPATNGMASRSGSPILGNDLIRESVEAPLRDGPVVGRPMDAVTRDRLEMWMQAEGMVLGEEVIRVMTLSTRTEANVRIAGNQTIVTCPGRMRTDKGREGMSGVFVDGPVIPIRLGMLGIGDVALTSVNAEIYNLISQRMKRASPMANTVMVTLADGSSPSGYIPDDASFSHNSFQVLNSHLKEGCAEDAIANGLDTLVTQYAAQKP